MTKLRLIADDLTGALDSGCAFATEADAVLIGLPWQPLPTGPRIAISTETRDHGEAAGQEIVAGAMRHLMPGSHPQTLWFKKIDSVMRGNPIAEAVAAFRAGGFDHCVFAPAFPDMGRVTVEGRQYLLGAERRQVGPDFVPAFAAHGLSAALRRFDPRGTPLEPPSSGVSISIIDAETQETLALRIAALRRRLSGRTLWIGTGGLAAALSGKRSALTFPPVHTVIAGTRHPATIAQIDRALAAGRLGADGSGAGDGSVPALLAPSLTSRDASETRARLRALAPEIGVGDPAQSTIAVIGGDTLSAVLESVEARYLECLGEVSTGVPLCRISGGGWNGVTLISKSGGFGGPDLLADLLAKG